MAADEAQNPQNWAVPDGAETAPLLGPSAALGEGYGSSASNGGSIVATENGRSNDAVQATTGGDHEGLPGMAQKLHWLLPAIGIGVFLSALDQTLIVATYAKMSSDLEALNRTSWISTA